MKTPQPATYTSITLPPDLVERVKKISGGAARRQMIVATLEAFNRAGLCDPLTVALTPQPGDLSVHIPIRLRDEDRKRIDELAGKAGVNRSKLIAAALRHMVPGAMEAVSLAPIQAPAAKVA